MKNKVLIDKLKIVQKKANKNIDEAITNLKEVLKDIRTREVDKEDYYEIAMIAADIFYDNEKYKQAVKFYEEALKLQVEGRNNIKCYINLADCYYELDNYDLSINMYLRAISYGGDKISEREWGKVYHGLAIDYLNSNNYEEAIRYYNKILEVYKRKRDEFEKQNFENALSSIATCYWKLGDDEKSEDFFRKLVAMPNVTTWILAKSYKNKGHRLFEQKIWDEALKNYIKAQDITDTEEEKEYLQPYIDRCRKEIEKQYN